MAQLTIPTRNNPGFDTLYIDYRGELMKNRVAATEVSPEHPISVVEDSAQHPIVFSIGNDDSCYVVYYDASSHTGWSKMDLTATIGKGLVATAFGAYQNSAGKIMIAVAAHDGSGHDAVYLSPYLDATPTNWTAAGFQWKARTSGEVMQVQSLLMGADPDGSQMPFVLAGVTENGEGDHWQVNADPQNTAWDFKRFQLPENAQGQLLDMALGQVEGHQGVYTLYNTSTGQSISFTSVEFSVPHVNKPQRLSYSYDLPGTVNAIEAISVGDGNTYLFGAGHGVVYWKNGGRVSTPVPGCPTGITKLVMRQDPDRTALWMVHGDELLDYMQVPVSSETWSVPLTIGQGVTQIAAQQISAHSANQVFTVKGDSTLSFFYQAPEDSLWHEQPIPLPALKGSIEYNSYTTELKLLENGSMPAVGAKLKLTASSLTYVMVNHVLHTVGPENEAELTTGADGTLTFINRVSTISTPTFTLAADWLTEAISMNPAANVQAGLAKITSAQSLMDAKLHDGSNLVSGVAPDKVQHAATAIQTLHTMGQNMQAPADPSARRARQAVSSIAMLGHHTGNPTLVVLDHARVDLSSWEDAIESVAGDVLHALEEGLESVGDWIIQAAGDVSEFLIRLGDSILKFAIETVEQVYRIINWVFKNLLGIDLDKLLAWLGFLFDWEDIKQTQAGIIYLVNSSMDIIVHQITNGEEKIQRFFDKVKGDIIGKDLASKLGKNAEMPISHAGGQTGADTRPAHPGGGFMQYHLNSPATLQGSDDGEGFGTKLVSQLMDILENLGISELQTMQNAFLIIAEQARTQTIGEVIVSAVEVLTAAVLQELENGILALMEVAKAFIEAVKGLLNQTWEIPVISELYKLFIGQDLTILNVISLVVAVPLTLVFKLATGKTPFSASQMSLLQTLVAQGTGQSDTAARVARPAMTMAMARTASADGQPADNQPKDNQPTEDQALLSFLLGGFCVSIGRTINGAMGIVAGLAQDAPPGAYFFGKFVVSILTYGASLGNKFLASYVKTGSIFSFDVESITVYGQAIWPIYDLISIPEPARPVVSVFKFGTGWVNLVMFAVIAVDNFTSDGDTAYMVDAGFKLGENVLLAVQQIGTPVIKWSEEEPEVLAVVLVVVGIGWIGNVLLNQGRASAALLQNKMFAPI